MPAARIRLADALGNFREITATPTAQDFAAGSIVNVTITQTTGGGSPPGAPSTLNLVIYTDSGTGRATIRTISLTPGSASQSVTFYLRHTGLSTGSPRAGTYEIAIRALRSAAVTYDVESDGSPNTPPTGFTATFDRGWVRGTTTAVITATPNPAAAGNVVNLAVDLAAELLLPRALTLALGPDSAATAEAVDGHSRTLVVDNTFPAASTVYTPTVAVPNATLTGQPVTVLTTVTADPVTVDPRITIDHRLQVNASARNAVPDLSRRLASQLGFVGFRLTNAAGAGMIGLTATELLRDVPELVGAAVNRTVTTDAAGWSPTLAPWDAQLPAGAWRHTVTITSADYAGLGVPTTEDWALLAPDPSVVVVCSGGPVYKERHATPGQPFQAGLAPLNVDTAQRLAVDTTLNAQGAAQAEAYVLLLRLQDTGPNAGLGEYLDANDQWQPAPADGNLHFHRLAETRPGSRLYVKTWLNTASWGAYDVFVVGKAIIGATPFGGQAKEIVVGAEHPHDVSILRKFIP